MVYVKKILVDHNRLFEGYEKEVKIGFLWKRCKKYKKNFVLYYHTSVFDQSFSILHFEGPGRRCLSENPYHQQLSGKKKCGNALKVV